MTPNDPARPLLSVRRLRVYHERGGLLRRSRVFKAVDDVHFDLRAGETLAIVGEAGSGKTTLADALLGAVPVTAGSIVFAGRERVGLGRKALQAMRAELRGVEQSPLRRHGRRCRVERLIGDALAEVLPKLATPARRQRVVELLARVGLGADTAPKRLAELDPLARAQVSLARALAVDPRLLVFDGPAEDLDDAGRAQLLETLARLQAETGFALVLTARTFADVRPYARRVLVLSLGRILEQGPIEAVTRTPAHPYSRRLLALAGGAPLEERTEEGELLSAREIPTADRPPMGCVFHTRCSLVERSCVQTAPLLKRTTAPEHYAACHFAPVP